MTKEESKEVWVYVGISEAGEVIMERISQTI